MAQLRGLAGLVAALVAVLAIASRKNDNLPARKDSAGANRFDPITAVDVQLATAADFDWLALVGPELGGRTHAENRAEDISPEDIIEEFRFAWQCVWPLVPVTIGGRKCQFVVDTGCTCCVVDCELEPILHETAETVKINNQARFDSYHLPQTLVGKCKLPVDGSAVCLDLEPFRKSSGYDIRGTLGMTFLRQHIIRFDFDAGKLTFLKRCPVNAGIRFPLSYTAVKTPSLDVIVGKGKSVAFELDTGAASPLAGQLTSETFDRLTRMGLLTDAGRTVGRFSAVGTEVRRQGTLSHLRLATFEHANVEFAEADVNRLGLGYLSRYVVTFDFPDECVYLRKGTRFER